MGLQELQSVKVVRREQITLSDKITAGLVKLSRSVFTRVSSGADTV